MPSDVVVTIPLAESAEKEEAKNEAIADIGMVGHAPVAGEPAEWSEAGKYGLGALVQEKGVIYRSQEAGNEKHKPSEDADFAHWAPDPQATYLLQNPAFTTNTQFGTLRTRWQVVGVSVDPAAYIYPYEAGKKYVRGEYSVEEGFAYQAAKATEGEAPATHPEAWTKLGPAIQLGA